LLSTSHHSRALAASNVSAASATGASCAVGVLGGAFNPTTTATDNLLHLAHTASGWQVGL